MAAASTPPPSPQLSPSNLRTGLALFESRQTPAAALAGAESEPDLFRACDRFEALAHQLAEIPASSPARTELLNRPTILLPMQPWFGFCFSELGREIGSRGFLPCFFSPDAERPELPDLDDSARVSADDWRDREHRGIRLWEVASYDFCVRHERSLAEVERDAAALLDELAREYDRARQLIDRAFLYLDAYRPQTVFIAQGHVLASAVLRTASMMRGVRVLAAENTLHAGRMLLDDDGALPVLGRRAHAEWLKARSLPATEAPARFAADYLQTVHALKDEHHRCPVRSDGDGAAPQRHAPEAKSDSAPQKTILYLAQVATDAAVLFGLGRGFRSQLEVVRSVARWAHEHGHRLLVKLHPKEAAGTTPLGDAYDRLSHRQFLADPAMTALLEHPGIEIDADNTLDTQACIESADLCVTINSQAGLEALLHGKELVVCGHAFYGELGVTHGVDDELTLRAALERTLVREDRRNDLEIVQRFFHLYLESVCHPKDARTLAEACVRRAVTAPGAVTSAPRDFGYDSGERQTAHEYGAIRRDHRERYEFAAEALAGLPGDRPLCGLDAFCGNGYGTWFLSERLGAQVVGIDGSAEAIGNAQQHFSNERTHFTALQFPFDLPQARFDFVTCFESVEHVAEDRLLLSRLAQALVPGGLLFLSTPNEEALPFAANADFFGFHERHYREAEILTLAASVGLAPRASAGQLAYRMDGKRALEPLPEDQMGLQLGLDAPHFLWHVFERIAEPEGLVDRIAREPGLRLDLGCGERGPKPGFQGVDIRPLPGVTTLAAMTELEAHFAPASVDEITSRHAFEHLSFQDGADAVASWSRVLKPAGKLQLIVPDLRYHIGQFLDPDPEARSETNPDWSAREHALAGFWGWQREHGTDWDIHKSGYDFEGLRALLQAHGFVDVVRMDDDPWNLNVVAWRPSAESSSTA